MIISSDVQILVGIVLCFAGVVGLVWSKITDKRLETLILPVGWRFYDYPTDGEPPGTVYRINRTTKIPYAVDTLVLPPDAIEEKTEWPGEQTEQLTIESAIEAGLLLVKTDLKGEGTAESLRQAKITLNIGKCTKEKVYDKDLKGPRSAFRKSAQDVSADDAYFVIRESRKTTDLKISATDEVLRNLGATIVAGEAKLGGKIWKANEKRGYTVEYTGEKPLRFMYKAEEIPIGGKVNLRRWVLGVDWKQVSCWLFLGVGVFLLIIGGWTPPPPPPPGMILIPAGELPAFWIDEHEVTNDEFNRINLKTQAEKDSGQSWIPNEQGSSSGETWVQRSGATWKQPLGLGSDIKGLGKHPVVHVNWSEAAEYCRLNGKRLPVEAEWVRAAGTGKYPWGNDAVDGTKANFSDKSMVGFKLTPRIPDIVDGYRMTAPVGSYPASASPTKVMDLAGNVWEWVGEPDGEGKAVAKGGSWTDGEENLQVTAKSLKPTGETRVDLGFRCAKSK